MDSNKIRFDNLDKMTEAVDYFQDVSNLIEVSKDCRQQSGVSGNIYALYVNDEIKYIGERQSGKITSRLNQHLSSCPVRTASKLDKVNEAFDAGKRIAYKTLLVEPDYERYSVETYLIQNINGLEWNIRDKSKKIMEISSTDDIEIEAQ